MKVKMNQLQEMLFGCRVHFQDLRPHEMVGQLMSFFQKMLILLQEMLFGFRGCPEDLKTQEMDYAVYGLCNDTPHDFE